MCQAFLIFRQAGRRAIPMDIRLNEETQDIMSPLGFLNAVWQVCNLRPGAGFFTAPVCSTWVFMFLSSNVHQSSLFSSGIDLLYTRKVSLPRSRGSTLRTKARPLGRDDSETVRMANVMVARVCVLLMLCQAKRVFWILEQPVNSLLDCHPCFQALLRMPHVRAHRTSTSMQWFGGPTRKPTWLYASPSDALAPQISPKIVKNS